MSHTQGTVTYLSTSASTRLSRASLVSLITCVRRRLSLKGHTRMSHVTHIFQLDMSLHTCAKCRSSLIKGHIRMSHVKHICEWVVLLHMCARCIFSFEGKGQYWISHVTCISRLSWKGHLQMNRVTRILEWVVSLHTCLKCRSSLRGHTGMSHVTLSWKRHERMNRVTHMNELYRYTRPQSAEHPSKVTYEWVILHIRMSNVAHYILLQSRDYPSWACMCGGVCICVCVFVCVCIYITSWLCRYITFERNIYNVCNMCTYRDIIHSRLWSQDQYAYTS